MQYKRLEIYLGWTCNHKCEFCMEMATMDVMWNRKITEREILKDLIKYKKQGYNHVTYLGGEPFIQSNFSFALMIGKKLGFTILVTTNASMIQYKKIAQKHLPFIDELVISLPIIDKKLQPIINNTKGIIDFDNVFLNIEKYWTGNFLKINTVITPKNLGSLTDILIFLKKYKIHEISFTYPDINYDYYKKDKVLQNIAVAYGDIKSKLIDIKSICIENNISFKIVDIPFCQLPDKSFIIYTDDYSYQARTKIHYSGNAYTRVDTGPEHNQKNQEIGKYESLPRMRRLIDNCDTCIYNKICWGPSSYYKELFGTDDIQPIL